MRRILFGLCVIAAGMGESLFGETEKNPNSAKATTVLYRFNLDLMYLTEFRGFSKDQGFRLDPILSRGIGNLTPATASLGLARSSLEVSWQLPRGAGVEVSLRPDAVATGEAVSEIDTRSGRVVETQPDIHFLDTYRIVLKRSGIETYIGVKANVFEDFTYSPELLGFGLRVQGPRKSFGLGFKSSDLFGGGGDLNYRHTRVAVAVDVLGGRSDRHDSKVGSTNDIGESPSKKEPYWGGSIQAKINYGDGLRLGGGGISVQERAESGLRQIDWYQFAIGHNFGASNSLPLLIAMEARHLKETYQKSEAKISDVFLTSFGLTSSLGMRSSERVLLSVWLGNGAIHPEGILSSSVSAKGLQADIGWRWMLDEQLELTTMASREWRRDGKPDGGSRGGFGDSKSGRSTQSRFALRVSYNIGDQI